MRPRMPVNVPRRQQWNRESASQQEMSPRGPGQPEPQPRTRRDRKSIQASHERWPAEQMSAAHQYIGAPLPRKPRLTRTKHRVAVRMRQPRSAKDRLAGANVPARIAVAEELPRTVKEKETPDEG